MLSETCLGIEERVSIHSFDCSVQFKGLGHPAVGVAIYHRQNNFHVVTPQMDITYCQSSRLDIVSPILGDICAAEFLFENGQLAISVVIYISSNQMVQKIKDFQHFVLLLHTEGEILQLNNNMGKTETSTQRKKKLEKKKLKRQENLATKSDDAKCQRLRKKRDQDNS
ncbi:hypothetical protein TNCV_1326601 [Trichonephila clavipes]|nr:hypothetical protein TNCV_1326601 [Trichonephila clavipes]